ncbi:SDR family oxidoreductase [Sphingobacterium bovisgrunnientis]|jgi:NAD(P)-dependent dehydrogenase (short-subunit alcohol dehydrogenase family)|uniref:SDR family oxidoreductase n=1 Tax=Sphingobacterium bovisgrunnientis TaxID=1874697 RepID=UPI00135CD863|nr:SDR family oxidoreductase [Sphingobacterium bovisgrunnientis]
MNNKKSKDPIQKYPIPPFPKQPQDVPGITSKMNPIPDHGEQSYVGRGLLKDAVCIITGGDSGIGKAVAIAMAREGAKIVISYKDKVEDEDAKETLDWIEKAGSEGILLRGDIRNENQCLKIVEKTISKYGRIDILVNNAAYQMTYNSIEDIDTIEWDKTFDTNIRAMFYLVKYAKPHMRPGSSIINTTSVNAYEPNPTLLPYAATKGAIQNFTASLAQMFMEDKSGIRVNAVAPGPIWTPLIPSTIPDHENFGKDNSPMGRPGQPAEIAPIYVFLASEAASYISGATIPATGGRVTI